MTLVNTLGTEGMLLYLEVYLYILHLETFIALVRNDYFDVLLCILNYLFKNCSVNIILYYL